MSAELDAAVAELKASNEELESAVGEGSDLSNKVNASNIRISEAQGRFDRARVALSDAAIASE